MKKWYRSSTVWFNVATFVAAAGLLISSYLIGAGVSKEVAGQVAGAAGLVSSLVNLWLRVALTKTAIAPVGGSG